MRRTTPVRGAEAVSEVKEPVKEVENVKNEEDVESEEEEDFPGLSVEANRGFGRGRPMGRFLEGPFVGRGMGRGRALAPPPGLQA